MWGVSSCRFHNAGNQILRLRCPGTSRPGSDAARLSGPSVHCSTERNESWGSTSRWIGQGCHEGALDCAFSEPCDLLPLPEEGSSHVAWMHKVLSAALTATPRRPKEDAQLALAAGRTLSDQMTAPRADFNVCFSLEWPEQSGGHAQLGLSHRNFTLLD